MTETDQQNVQVHCSNKKIKKILFIIVKYIWFIDQCELRDELFPHFIQYTKTFLHTKTKNL